MSCQIIKRDNGTNIVLDSKGNNSTLYDGILSFIESNPFVTSELIPTDDVNDLALQYYNLSNSLPFRNKYNLSTDLNKEVSIDDIINHIETEYSLFNDSNNIKEGVNELFESNPELANSVYEALGFKQTITQDNKSYYRGQIEEPTIDKDGNLVLYAKEDELYKRAGLKSKGVSMTDDLQSAIEYGSGQLTVAKNLSTQENIGIDLERELDKLDENGYYLIQIPKNISNEIVKEAGEVKVVGDKIIISKGQYKIEQVVDGVEQITPQQKQQAQQLYSQYLEKTGNQDIEGFKEFVNSNNESVSTDFGVNTKIEIPKVDKLSNEDKRKELDLVLNAVNKLKRDKVYSEKTINTVTRMMLDLGFNLATFDEILAKSNKPYLKKENAIVDIAAKMIHLSEGGTITDYFEEIGHIISAQLDGEEFEQALELIKNDPKYTSEMEKYIAIYQSEEKYTGEEAVTKAATEVLGQLLGDQLANKLETEDNVIVRLLKSFINRVLSLFKNQYDLHRYVEQSVDYFINTPNRPFKRETHYYSLEQKKNEYQDLLFNLKRQRSKLVQLQSKYNIEEEGVFNTSDRKTRLDNQIKFLSQEAINANSDVNMLKYLDEMLNDTNDIIGWISKYREVKTQEGVYNIGGREETLLTFEVSSKYKLDFDISNVSIRALSDARDYVNNYTYSLTALRNIIENNERLTDGDKIILGIYISNLESRLKFINTQVESLDKLKSEELIKTLVKETGVSSDFDSLPESVRNSMMDYEQTKDINSAEVWFGPMGMVNSSLSRLVDGLFNLIYNNARIKTIDFSNNFLTKFKSYIGKDMSFLAEKYEGKTTGDFIDEYHWGQWNIERTKALEKIATSDKYNFKKDSHLRNDELDMIRTYNDYKKELNKQLKDIETELEDTNKLSKKYKPLVQSKTKIEDLIKHYDSELSKLDDYLDEINEWYNENSQPRHNALEIIDEYKKRLSVDDFNIWYDRNVIRNSKNVVIHYKGELSQPSEKWRNKDFNRLTSEQKRILTEIKEYKKEFDIMLGLPTNTLMPQMYQSMLNSLLDSKLSNIAGNVNAQFKRAFTRTSDDTQFEPEQELRHFQEDNRVVSYLGSRYTKRLHNPEHISTDILASMIGYAQMAYEFKEKMQRLDQFELLAQKMKKTKFSNSVNETSNSFKKLKTHLETHLMEKTEKPAELKIPGTNININVNKVLAGFNKLISHTNLAFGGVTQLANVATSRINLLLENILGQHTTIKSNTFAHKEFVKLYTGETLKDTGKTVKTNKLDLMMRYFGLSENADKVFNDLNKNIFLRNPVGKAAYFGYEAGSYYIGGITMISILKNNRLFDGKLYTEQAYKDSGNTTPYDSLVSAYDSIVVKDGKLEIIGLEPSQLNLLVNKIRDLNKKLDGKLTKEDYAMAHSNMIGMSALIHRNWIIDGAFRRLKSKGLNFKTGEEDEGYWITTKNVLSKFFYSKEKLKVIANLYSNYKKLSRSEQLGLNRTLLDLSAIATFASLAIFIFNGEDDENDDSQFLAYLSNRILLELFSFYNPIEMFYAVKDPIVSARQMETLLHFGNALDFEEIERGKWEGYTRSEKYWLSLIPGVKGVMQMSDTGASNQFLKNKQLTWLY